VKRWNAREAAERKKTGTFRKLDLSGQKLAGIELGHLDFQGAVFDHADLKKAQMGGTNLRQASFKGARLDGAWLSGARLAEASFEGASLVRASMRVINSLRGANFQGADLSYAALDFSDLRGCDLSGARLGGANFVGAKFDEQTRFPPKFELPDGLRWHGAGADPRLAAKQAPAAPAGSLSFEEFMDRLRAQVKSASLAKALAMLKAEKFQLFAQAEADSLLGVVKSQTNPNLAYSCRLTSTGGYSCCTQNLNRCGGLQGSLCKHILVLVVGLARAGQLDAATVSGWVELSRAQRPALDEDVMSATFLRYKGAEAGEVDWRPTETIPEDYYAL
jgi:uncharacterized protein YjbI with pentapeptide repeats